MNVACAVAGRPSRQIDRSRDRCQFTDDDFQIIAGLAMRDFGLNLTLAKRDLVYSRLLKRLKALDLDLFRDYCALLISPEGEAERAAMLSALTTNVTQFFRENHHFALMRDVALPPLIKAARAGARVRLWSAGCSAGQEPYSLAFTVLTMCPEAAQLNLRILATDVDAEILAKAEAGLYQSDERKAIPEGMRRFIEPAPDDGFTIGAAARSLVTFGQLNLIENWPISGPFQVIFCRNVAIYFDKPTQTKLWARLGGLLSPNGHLCIGHSERVAGPAEHLFHGAGVTAYQKQPPGCAVQNRPDNRPAVTASTSPNRMEGHDK